MRNEAPAGRDIRVSDPEGPEGWAGAGAMTPTASNSESRAARTIMVAPSVVQRPGNESRRTLSTARRIVKSGLALGAGRPLGVVVRRVRVVVGWPRLAESVRVDAVLAHQVVQRRPAHVDLARRAGHVAGVARQALDQQPPLRLVARRLQRRDAFHPDLGQLEVLGPQVGVARQDDAALDAVLQLAHVAGPGVPLDRAQPGLGEALEATPVLAGVVVEEVGGEDAGVVAAVAQR